MQRTVKLRPRDKHAVDLNPPGRNASSSELAKINVAKINVAKTNVAKTNIANCVLDAGWSGLRNVLGCDDTSAACVLRSMRLMHPRPAQNAQALLERKAEQVPIREPGPVAIAGVRADLGGDMPGKLPSQASTGFTRLR